MEKSFSLVVAGTDVTLDLVDRLSVSDTVAHRSIASAVVEPKSVSLGEAIFMTVVVSLFAGLMPVPGGVGVYEADAAGLVAAGVDNDIAVSAVLVYRMCSFSLPPLWGLHVSPLAPAARLPVIP